MAIPTALYVHVPFCRSRCAYCDFFSSVPRGSAGGQLMEDVVRGTVDRLESLVSRFGVSCFSTLYVGGGTPSLLPRPILALLLSALGRYATGAVEWTVEANPESLDEEFLDILEGEGVSRVSIGVQSLDDGLLSELGRPASAAEALSAVEKSARRKLRVSADLIAGVGRKQGLAKEAERLALAGAKHLSIYDLTLEEGTPLEARFRRGEFAVEEEDRAADEREGAEALLASLGFFRYEVSNYALPGQESEHNLVYWRMGSWLGVGPGAVGSIAVRPRSGFARAGLDGTSLRMEEGTSLEAYAAGRASESATETPVGAADSAFETLMMAFRTREGLDTAAFARRFGIEAEALVGATLAKWKDRVVRSAERIALDGRGLDLGNAFLADCLAELDDTFPPGGEAAPDPEGYTKKS